MKKYFIAFSTMLFITACTPTVKLKPLDLEVAADLPAEVALGWLQQMPRDMKCCVTPAYPLPCQYTKEGIITAEWEGLFPPRKGKDNPLRPWQDFVTRPGNMTYVQYSVQTYNEGTPYESCQGLVGLETTDGKEMCAAYYTKLFEELPNGRKKVIVTDCKTVSSDVEKPIPRTKQTFK